MSLHRGMHRPYIKYLFLTVVTDPLIGEGQRTHNDQQNSPQYDRFHVFRQRY